MRKAQKQQAEELLKLLEEAHHAIKKAIEKKKAEEAMELLAQCQDSAIGLGELIEQSEGEGFPTIHLLEEYCELVYRIHGEVGENQAVNANGIQKELQRMLVQIENSVKNEIPVRKEVVFLPYKASMWDSLESIWKKTDADESCDAYVIPIPYYDKNPDGSFREMHYEGEEYPAYVPVTHFQAYDFAERRPDVVYIHNPYDECNHVTSVHPFYYSKNLKNYTEQLVYVPYFILNEVDPNNTEAVERMKHFCMVPGVVNADTVIVQSENMRQVYIQVMMEFTGSDAASRAYWENKIFGHGSPKVDKVLNTKKEDLKMPEDWLKVIVKPDGNWKKIIFYNTSVNALLKHNEKMLEKMNDVFRIFWEQRDEVALLWRPHPLIKATIESMRPKLWQEYEKMVEQYRKEGWGIYDDSAELDRAIVLSDAYYGDESSVVQLCQKAGKPVMVQNVEMG